MLQSVNESRTGVLETGGDRRPSPAEAILDAATEAGSSFPIGATVHGGGVNFNLYSRNATRVEWLLFDRADDAQPSRIVPIDPVTNGIYHYWHVDRRDLAPGQTPICRNAVHDTAEISARCKPHQEPSDSQACRSAL